MHTLWIPCHEEFWLFWEQRDGQVGAAADGDWVVGERNTEEYFQVFPGYLCRVIDGGC